MQNYKENQEEHNIYKKIVLEFLSYLAYKIKTDSMTVEETESLARTFTENISLSGTTEDFARFYGQSKENVKVVINRKLLAKPRRAVLYPFDAFRKVIPERWRESYKSKKNK